MSSFRSCRADQIAFLCIVPADTHTYVQAHIVSRLSLQRSREEGGLKRTTYITEGYIRPHPAAASISTILHRHPRPIPDIVSSSFNCRTHTHILKVFDFVGWFLFLGWSPFLCVFLLPSFTSFAPHCVSLPVAFMVTDLSLVFAVVPLSSSSTFAPVFFLRHLHCSLSL